MSTGYLERIGTYGVLTLFSVLAIYPILSILFLALHRKTDLVTGFAFLPMVGGVAVATNLSNIVLMPRIGPKSLVTTGMLVAAGAMTWFAHLGAHTAYVDGVLGPLILTGIGLGMVIAPSINTGTFGVA